METEHCTLCRRTAVIVMRRNLDVEGNFPYRLCKSCKGEVGRRGDEQVTIELWERAAIDLGHPPSSGAILFREHVAKRTPMQLEPAAGETCHHCDATPSSLYRLSRKYRLCPECKETLDYLAVAHGSEAQPEIKRMLEKIHTALALEAAASVGRA